MKRCLEQGATIIMVNRTVWMVFPEHELILWGRLGDIENVTSIFPRLIERVIAEAQKAIEGAKVEIELAEEMDQITLYSKTLGLLLWARDGHSEPNRDMVRQLLKDRIKEVHPLPYIDKCLPIADWNDPMWNTEGFKFIQPEHIPRCEEPLGRGAQEAGRNASYCQTNSARNIVG